MAARQLWAFLTDRDVEELIAKIAAREPGLVVSQGRYLRGDPRMLLEDPAKLERRESLPGERRIYLLHRKHCSEIVAHVQPAGPFEGWAQIDEDRTDCLVLRLKETTGQATVATITVLRRGGVNGFQTDFLEGDRGAPLEPAGASFRLTLAPYQLATVRIVPRANHLDSAGSLRV